MRNKRKILTGIEVELLDLELDFIKSVFLESGYPFEVTKLTITYIGSASKWFRTAVQRAVNN